MAGRNPGVAGLEVCTGARGKARETRGRASLRVVVGCGLLVAHAGVQLLHYTGYQWQEGPHVYQSGGLIGAARPAG